MGTKGIVFFLSAGKKDVTFYLDGRIELLSICILKPGLSSARGLYPLMCGLTGWRFFDVSIHLKVNYQDFNRGRV